MKILSKIKNFRVLRRLRAAARTRTSPATLGALAERYIALGRIDDAFRAASQGISLFPTSERLAKVLNFAKKHRLQDEISRLRRDLATRPAPMVYSQLAEIYRELGKHDQALSICEECIEKYPLNENPYLILGEVRLCRFLDDLIAHDGLEAERQLRRVVKLNPQNVKAHMLLAQLAHVVGATDEAIEHIDAVVALSPDTGKLEAFVADLRTNNTPDELEEGLTLGDRIRDAEFHGSTVNSPDEIPGGRLLPGQDDAEATKLDVRSVSRAMRQLGKTPGVVNAIVIDKDGETVADHSLEGSVPASEFAEIVAEIVATSEDTSRRMDVGSFQWCSVEGDFGGISVTRSRKLSVGLMHGQKLSSDRAQVLLEDFTSRNLTAPGEVSRA